jgi:RND family efflux transporter MFP subunit
LQSNSVSKQETDEKISDLSVKKAAFEGSAANVNRLEDLQSFQKVYAPFDGVVTARNTDIGALVSAGVNGTGKELFHLAAISKLRVFVSVPQTYSRASRPGAVAAITVAEFPGRTFRGVVARTANSIDPASRTLLTEVDIDNPSGELLPGAYVSVHLKLPGEVRSLVLPSNTLIFRSEGLRVAVIRNGHAQLIPVTVGRDYGDRVEVLSGIKPEDAVVADPSDSLIDGTPVRLPEKASE